jgi:hypothetical protein
MTTVARDDAEAAQRPETLQRQADARFKAELLAEQAQRLGNQAWRGLAQTASRTAKLLNLEPSALAKQASPLWSLSQSLATYAAQDDRLSKTPANANNGEPLSADLRRALDDLLTALPVLVRRFPSIQRDDLLLSAEANRPVNRKEINRFFNRIEEIHLLNAEADETVKALYASPQNASGSMAERRIGHIVIGTARNLGSAALGSAANRLMRQASTAEGSLQADTELDRKTRELITTESETIASLYRDIPDLARTIHMFAQRIANGARIPAAQDIPARPALSVRAPFDLEAVHKMIVRGESPPKKWVSFIVELDFRSSELTDLTPLTGLTHLKALDLDCTQVAELLPLAELKKLQSLHLYSTQVTDLGPLAGLEELERLDLNSTKVAHLDPLARLKQLKSLHLNSTPVRDLTPLSKLSQLRLLDLDSTLVADVKPLAKLTQLESLFLCSTRVTDFRPLLKLGMLERIGMRDSRRAARAIPVFDVHWSINKDGDLVRLSST